MSFVMDNVTQYKAMVCEIKKVIEQSLDGFPMKAKEVVDKTPITDDRFSHTSTKQEIIIKIVSEFAKNEIGQPVGRTVMKIIIIYLFSQGLCEIRTAGIKTIEYFKKRLRQELNEEKMAWISDSYDHGESSDEILTHVIEGCIQEMNEVPIPGMLLASN